MVDANFNLLISNWIPILRTNGTFKRLGVRDVLTQAGAIRQIAASNPMDNVSLLRFLLAVLMWCKPELSNGDRQKLEIRTGVPEQWLTNLGTPEEPAKAFNLPGYGARFMPAPEAAAKDRPVADLYHELPGDSNKAHFRHIRDYQGGACPACIAIGLIRLPVAITGKGSGKRPGINGDPPMYFVPVGRTLLETLMLHWPLATVVGDQPCWSTKQHCKQQQVGIMEGFTWTSRQFRIPEEGLKHGTCMICGSDTDDLVVRLQELNEPNGRVGLNRCDASRWLDPHIIYNYNNKPWKAEDAEKNLSESSGQWREWLAGLLHGSTVDLNGSTDGLSCPTSVAAAAANHFDSCVSIHVAGLAMQSSDKSVESCACSLKIDRGNGEGSVNLKSLDNTVSNLLDPKASFKGKKLAKMKAKHPLRVIRSIERPLSDAIRAALADRLPALEARMFESMRSQNGYVVAPVGSTFEPESWQSLIKEVANATTPGSPLRRREAMARARLALDNAIRDFTTNPESVPPRGGRSQSGDTKSHKPKITRRKKGVGT